MISIETIAKYKLSLIGVELVGIALLGASLLSLRAAGSVPLGNWQLFCTVAGALIFAVAFFPLCYLSWFHNKEKSAIFYAKQTFFWVLTISFIAVFATILVKIGLNS